MAINDNMKKRLSILEEAICPRDSLAYKVKHLLPYEREVYERWLKENSAWHAERPGEIAYAELLAHSSGDQTIMPPPDLPFYLKEKLFGIIPEFSEKDSLETTQAKYMDVLEKMK